MAVGIYTPGMNLGDKVLYCGKKHMILKKEVCLKQGCLEASYLIGFELAIAMHSGYRSDIQGIHLMGVVTQVHENQLQIQLDIEKRESNKNRFLFPYLPVTGNGLYAMPELGSKVFLYFPGCREKEAFIINCILEPVKKHWNFADKHFHVSEQKKLCMESDKMELLGRNSHVSVRDKSGLGFHTAGKIKIRADEDVWIRCRGINYWNGGQSIGLANQMGRDSIRIEGTECRIKTAHFTTSDGGRRANPAAKDLRTMMKSRTNAEKLMPKVMGAMPVVQPGGTAGKVLAGIPSCSSVKTGCSAIGVSGIKLS